MIAVLSQPVGVKWVGLLLVALVLWRQDAALRRLQQDMQALLQHVKAQNEDRNSTVGLPT